MNDAIASFCSSWTTALLLASPVQLYRPTISYLLLLYRALCSFGKLVVGAPLVAIWEELPLGVPRWPSAWSWIEWIFCRPDPRTPRVTQVIPLTKNAQAAYGALYLHRHAAWKAMMSTLSTCPGCSVSDSHAISQWGHANWIWSNAHIPFLQEKKQSFRSSL